MNYYEHHLGDYAKDTTSLSMLEEGAYRRLIDAYYAKEAPLPADRAKVCRIARAISRQEKDAVHAVLDEYFILTPDGHRHKRCDEEIERYQAGQEDAGEKRENEKERQKRHRVERKVMFETLRARGIVPPWDSSTATLRGLIGVEAITPPVTKTVTAPVTPVTAPVTRTATATSPQSPVPSPHTQKKNTAAAPPPPDGVSEPVWVDFLKVRKAKKAAVTDTAIEGIRREAEKAGVTLQFALETCCQRGWSGFRADWILERNAVTSRPVQVPANTSAQDTREYLDRQYLDAAPPSADVRKRMAEITGKLTGKAAA